MKEFEKIIVDISNKDKIIHKELYDVIDTIKKDDDLSDYLKKINIENTISNYYIFYSPDDKNVYVNYNALIYKTAQIIKDLSFEKKSNKLFFLNIVITRILLHEIEHAKQHRKIDNNRDFEAKVLLSSNELEMILKKQNKYNKNSYNINPLEIDAEAKSLRQISNLLKIYDDPNAEKFFQDSITLKNYDNYKEENKKIISPSEMFFSQDSQYLTIKDDINTMDLSNYSFSDRTDLGLKISLNEYKRIKKEGKLI